MKTLNKRYKILYKFRKLQGIKNPYKATFYRCECNCGKEFQFRSEKLKTVIACKTCTHTIKTNEKKGGLFLTEPNFSLKRRKFLSYIKRAKAKKLEFKLSIEEALKLFNSDCHYCGAPPQQINSIVNDGTTLDGKCYVNTIDRVDSSKGYVSDNVVPSCNTCNTAKLNSTQKDFLDWINKVYNFQKDKKSSSTIPHEGSTLK